MIFPSVEIDVNDETIIHNVPIMVHYIDWGEGANFSEMGLFQSPPHLRRKGVIVRRFHTQPQQQPQQQPSTIHHSPTRLIVFFVCISLKYFN